MQACGGWHALPTCGTGGFLLAAHDYIVRHNKLDRSQKKYLKEQALHGVEIVDNTARLCAMNWLLHGIENDETPPVVVDGSLKADSGERYDIAEVPWPALSASRFSPEPTLGRPCDCPAPSVPIRRSNDVSWGPRPTCACLEACTDPF
jgi:hypothetical protein